MLKRWNEQGGYRQVLEISLPLVASLGSTSVMEFTDRIFLGNYSLDSIAAATPAGITAFLLMCFFMGLINYTNVFIAQYHGAGQKEKVGASLWQGIYCAIISGAILCSFYFLAEPLFALAGHSPEVQKLEVTYFRILNLGAGAGLIASALSCFFTGRGHTKPVMIVYAFAATINIPLDYAMINGVWFFPEMGIKGAGLATVFAWCVSAVCLALLVFRKEHDRIFGVLRCRAFNAEIFKRMLKFGLPGGVQFFLEIFAFTFFVFMTGRLGKTELAITNIVLSINSLAFMPMIGLNIGICTMVGQAIGKENPQLGSKAVASAFHISLSYMVVICTVFIFAPNFLLGLFRPQEISDQDFANIVEVGSILLKFVAVYTVSDAVALIFSGAIKGAGDTPFIMKAMFWTSLSLMIAPVYLAVEVFHADIYTLWLCSTFFVSSLGIVFFLRYRGGKWKKMNVIGR